MEEMWTLSDAHGHIGTEEELGERQRLRILSMICAVSPGEAERLLRRTGNWDFQAGGLSRPGQYLVPACGVHPWYADRYGLEDMEKWMALCPVIGEIGMDSVWCGVDLRIQEERFCQQLRLARSWGRPVVLHTKGQEREISDILREYPNRYLVHWYSCDSYLENYLELGCYFSVGPDVWWNTAVQQVARRVPADRLLIETDGLEAVEWAWEEGAKARSGWNMSGVPAEESGMPGARTDGGWMSGLREREPRAQEIAPGALRVQEIAPGEPRAQEIAPGALRVQELAPGEPRAQEVAPSEPQAREIAPGEAGERVAGSLARTLRTTARIRGEAPEVLGRQIRDNLVTFIGGGPVFPAR